MTVRGLVVGAFLPPYADHTVRIDMARAGCDVLTVLVCAHDDQPIAGVLRAAWLRELHPDVAVVLIDDRLGDGDVPGWAPAALRTLGGAPDVVFSSGEAGEAFARALGARHIDVGEARAQVPLAAPVRAYDVPRIVLAGAESTGKTTLAHALAKRFGQPYVAEYGREYTEVKYRDGMVTDAWKPAEFVHIAREQERREDAAARTDGARFVVADTDAFVTRLWYERYLSAAPCEPGWPIDRARERIYLVPEPDVVFVRDAIRDGEHFRAWMHERTLSDLSAQGREVQVLRGSYDDRTREAMAFVEGRFFGGEASAST